MLNKIRIIGKVLSPNKQETSEQKEKLTIYFSLLVPTPSGSLTILRCIAQQEVAEKLDQEIKSDEVIEVSGYLRNEREGRQMLIKVIEFHKVELNFENLEGDQANRARLIGKIITDFEERSEQNKSGIISFKLLVPQRNNDRDIYFCRINSKAVSKIASQLKKGIIVLVEAFLQTKKVVGKGEGEGGYEGEDIPSNNIERISSLICQSIILLDHGDPSNDFYPLDKLELIKAPVEKIDFNKPKEKFTK